MDYQIPIYGWLDNTTALAEDQESRLGLARLPIIALTANAMQG